MRPAWHRRWRVAVIVADAVAVTVVLSAVAVARFGPQALRDGFVPQAGRDFAQAPILLGIPVWLAAMAVMRLYSPQRCRNALEEGRRLATAGLAAALGLVMAGFLVKQNPARSWLFAGLVAGTLGVAIGRKTVRAIASRRRAAGGWMTKTVVAGRGQAKSMVETLLADRGHGIEPVAICGAGHDELPSYPLGDLAEAITATGATDVIVVAEDLERHETALALEVADELPVQLVVLPGLDHLLLGSLQLVTVGNEPGLAVEAPSVRTHQAVLKRSVDLVAGSLFLLAASPLLLACALAIRLDSPGRAIFRQKREGRGGATFELVKFRTMRDGAGDDVPDDDGDIAFLSKAAADDRITRVGRILRRTSLDELPQLWNVVRGDMSLVGPRPLPLWEAERLALRRRLVVRPGLTGLWQVSGRSDLSPEERVRLDLVYVQNWSLLLDISILLRTVPAVVGGRGAY